MTQNIDYQATSILQDVFGYPSFRGSQADVIADVCAGKHVLAVMPTGAGKSLCFQVPALMRRGLAVVVSPLISLMQNQVQALQLLGVEAASLNSGTPESEASLIWQKIHAGTLKLLYVSPERLMAPGMLSALSRHTLGLFAIDEAHCISQWGAAFRPEYEALSELRTHFPAVPIIALTATADQATRAQICEKIFAGNVEVYLSGFDRPNIALTVEIKNGWKQQLLHFLACRIHRHGRENGIIYCLSRKKCEEVAALLSEKGYNTAAYHAGMADSARQNTLNRFMAEDDIIVVATIAFGMGIDKPDIRFVFHTDLPASPEAYYQEIGRAGRDGAAATAHMLYGMQDINLRRQFINNEASSPEHKRREHQRLNALLAYCEAPACRRAALLSYFGDKQSGPTCGNCDLCLNPVETIDATTAGRKFLSAIARTGESFGVEHICDILVGKSTPKINQRGHDQLPTFGVGKEFSHKNWKSIARQLLAQDYIAADATHGSLLITEAGRLLLQDKATFAYRPDVLSSNAKGYTGANGTNGYRGVSTGRNTEDSLSDDENTLLLALKGLRRTLAQERDVPAYVIFSDKTLADMARRQPTTLIEFADVHGVGDSKLRQFGDTFTQFINAHMAEHA